MAQPGAVLGGMASGWAFFIHLLMKSATLYFREGSSDKVYTAAIEPRNNLFVVTFAYGRRGATMQTGIKTPTPVDLPTAERVFEKLVGEKKAKGYTPGENGVPYQQSDNSNVSTGIRPQLLNAIDEAEAARLVASSEWCMQEKKDGRRLLIRKEGSTVTGVNRRGLSCSLPVPVVQEIMDFQHDFIIDGEIVGETYFVFDMLLCEDKTWMLRPYKERLDAMDALFNQDQREHVVVLETNFDPSDKFFELKYFQANRAEGVVFKLLSAPYSPGRPASGGPGLKYKFTTTCSCIVGGVNAGKRSVKLLLLDETKERNVGNVTIPPNFSVPKVGAVVEVRYLYAFPQSGALYQPVYMGIRADITIGECGFGQLKFKQEDEGDDQ